MTDFEAYGPSQNCTLTFIDNENDHDAVATQESQFEYGQFSTQSQSQNIGTQGTDIDGFSSQSLGDELKFQEDEPDEIPAHACK